VGLAADRDPDRARRRGRPGDGARARRGRLRGQAVLAPRARRPRARRPPPRRAGRRARDRAARRRRRRARGPLGHRRRHAGRADREGVRPALVLRGAPRPRALARAPARPGLGNGVPRRHPHRGRPRRAAAQEARPAEPDSHDPRLGLQGGRLTRWRRPRSLRGRLFAGLAATAAVSALVTLLVGGVLTRRSLEREALRSLARQIDLIAAQRAGKPIARRGTTDLGDFLATEQERLAILAPEQADLLLPGSAVAAMRSRGVATGSLELHGTRYLYAARRNGPESLVLLRSARKQSGDLTPFLLGLGVAAGVGAALAALVAVVLARAVARPVTRVAAASRRLAAGEQPAP